MTIFGEEETEFKGLIDELRDTALQQRNILTEIKQLHGIEHLENEKIISHQIKELIRELNKLNERIPKILHGVIIPRVLKKQILDTQKFSTKKEENFKKVIKEDSYAKFANTLFSRHSRNLIEKNFFKALQVDLEKSNLMYLFPTYISIILFTTLLAAAAGLILFTFFIFFSIQPHMPIIKPVEDVGLRALKLIWILIAFPIAGFFISYVYPSLDRRAYESQIDAELPFATINMAAISNSLINPVKIFEIIISSGEFTKLMNHINVHGYSVVNALTITAYSSPSKKMSELLSGLATTINSGGDLTRFFETRAETLLFDYKLRREKETKTAETFMDLYISIVIAAPMIFMLLLMIMKISGLGISLPTTVITLMMVSGVAMINVFFLIFLHLKKTE